MRKSSRAIKKPEIFTFANNVEAEEASSNSSDGDDDFEANVKQRKLSRSSDGAPKKPNASTAVKESYKGMNAVFDGLMSGNMANHVDNWITSFKDDRTVAMVDLVNCVLMASGAAKPIIERDVDLDALEAEDLDELLSELKEEMISAYPLKDTSKKAKSHFRARYEQFWKILADNLLNSHTTTTQAAADAKSKSSLSSSSASRQSALETLLMLVDQLVALSSTPLFSVREAVVQAVLLFGQRIVAAVVSLKEQISSTLRLMNAESGLKAGGGAGAGGRASQSQTFQQSSKYQAYAKQKTSMQKCVDEFLGLSSSIFNAIFVHRFKDSHSEIRLICTHYLTEWLTTDPAAYFKDDYLKYVGWMLFDKDANVRREAVLGIGSLLEASDHLVALTKFVERFTERFIEIAAGDVDYATALAMMSVLRVLQQKGLLDTVTDESLGEIDEVIFDPSVTVELRREALLFFFDHTTGFDLEDEEVAEQPDKRTKSASKTRLSLGDATGGPSALLRRRKTASQLETLAEFAEHHLMGPEGDDISQLDKVDLLAAACMSLSGFDVLLDWATMISLLLRETDDDSLTSTSLSSNHIAILVRMFVWSATSTKRQYQALSATTTGNTPSRAAALIAATSASSSSSLSVSTPGKRKAVAAAVASVSVTGDTPSHSHAVAGSWQSGSVNRLSLATATSSLEGLHVKLQDLPRLFIRFRDNEDTIVQLSKMFEMFACDIVDSLGNTAAQQLKNLKQFVKIIVDGFESSSNVLFLSNCASILRQWRKMEALPPSIKTHLESTIVTIVSSLWDVKILPLSKFNNELQETPLESDLLSSSRRKPVKAKSSQASQSQSNRGDVTLAGFHAIGKYKILWQALDLREFLDGESAESVCDSLHHIADVIVSSKEVSRKACATAGEDLLTVLTIVIMWHARDVMLAASNPQTLAADDDAEANISQTVELIMVLRGKLVELLNKWLNPETLSDDVPAFSRAVQRAAFKTVGDLRLLFPVREKEFKYVNNLAYAPSQETLSLLRQVFGLEGQRIQEELAAAQDITDNAESIEMTNAICDGLLQSLLCPLSTALLADIENLNRRQAAAVVMYLQDSRGNEQVHAAIRGILKRLKDADSTKLMEVILVALKSSFTDEVLAALSPDRDEDEGNADDDVDMQQVQIGYENIFSFAKKLASTLGVGRVKGELATALTNFVKAGMEISLTTANCDENFNNLGFIEAIGVFLRYLPAASLVELSNHLEDKLENCPDIQQLGINSATQDWTYGVKAFQFFKRQLLSETKSPARKPHEKVSTTSSPPHPLASKSPKRAAVQSTGKTTGKSKSKSKGSASKAAAAHEAAGEEEAGEVEEEEEEVAAAPSRRSSRSAAQSASSYVEASSEEEEEAPVSQSQRKPPSSSSSSSSSSAARPVASQPQSQESSSVSRSRVYGSKVVTSSSSSSSAAAAAQDKWRELSSPAATATLSPPPPPVTGAGTVTSRRQTVSLGLHLEDSDMYEMFAPAADAGDDKNQDNAMQQDEDAANMLAAVPSRRRLR